MWNNTLLWLLIGYLSGSVLYSKLIARYFLRQNIAQIGDGNPGATNVAKVGGARWAALAFTLDCLKAAVPVGIAYIWLGIRDWQIIPIGLSPALGHAYPVFFGFKGGKGIAAIAGAWVGIALYEIITIGGLMLFYWYVSVRESAWATIFMVLSTGLYLALTQKPILWLAFWLASLLFLIWTHRRDLLNPPGVQPWVTRVASLWH